MRILHFVSALAAGSGVMSVIMNYYRRIDRTQIQFDFLCFVHCDNSYEDEITSYGGKVYYVDKPAGSVKSLKKLDDFIRQNAFRYQWFHNHEVYLSFYLRPLTRKYGIKNFVIHSHATQYSDKWINARRNQLLCFPVPYMKCKKVACSEAAGVFLFGKRAIQAKQVFILHNAVECDRYRFDNFRRQGLREKMHLADKLVIGHVGRFERQKNHEFMLVGFRHFHQIHPESVLILIGTGSLQPVIQQLIEKLQLEDAVMMLGYQKDVRDWYQVMDQFWLPSLFEGLPMAAVEAQANGLPCLISTAVTREVSLLDGTKYIDLDDGPERWAQAADQIHLNTEREVAADVVRQAGFDVEEESKRLQAFYMTGV